MSQTLQSVLCITINKYLVRVLVVLLHARFSVVGPLLAAIFLGGHPYIGSTTVLPNTQVIRLLLGLTINVVHSHCCLDCHQGTEWRSMEASFIGIEHPMVVF